MEKISWKDKKTNQQVLEIVGERRTLIETITGKKKKWIGHILRRDSLLKEVIEGRMEGQRPKGRRRVMMLDDLKMKDSYA